MVNLKKLVIQQNTNGSNENNVILMTAGTYVDKNIKISLTGSSTDFQNYYTGNSAPSADLGNDGDIYFKTQG